jgi:hypothetical protein
MIEREGKRFNCCESVLMKVNAKHEENKAKGIYYCEDFVFWSANKVLEIFDKINI